ncbi:MAG: hypothetical protein LBK99_03055, partial [Opitutaceae bacterium]|nr:hypothetical protein [Opitutaceae bacterium]
MLPATSRTGLTVREAHLETGQTPEWRGRLARKRCISAPEWHGLLLPDPIARGRREAPPPCHPTPGAGETPAPLRSGGRMPVHFPGCAPLCVRTRIRLMFSLVAAVIPAIAIAATVTAAAVTVCEPADITQLFPAADTPATLTFRAPAAA